MLQFAGRPGKRSGRHFTFRRRRQPSRSGFERMRTATGPADERYDVAVCEVCGNDYDKSFEVIAAGARHTFDSFECANPPDGPCLRALRLQGDRARHRGRPLMCARARIQRPTRQSRSRSVGGVEGFADVVGDAAAVVDLVAVRKRTFLDGSDVCSQLSAIAPSICRPPRPSGGSTPPRRGLIDAIKHSQSYGGPPRGESTATLGFDLDWPRERYPT
jgi:hypothetical protein